MSFARRFGFSAFLALAAAGCPDVPEGPCPLGVCEGTGGGAGGGSGGGAGGGTPVTCNGPPGLYVDGSCTVLAEGVRFFQPRYWLWTDGADKKRYIYLPPGTQIDTTDPDGWVFPVGTRLYKTFLVDGVRIETRLLEKRADVDADGGTGEPYWIHVAYAWDAAQTSVNAVPDGVEDALGTDHDIPSSEQCLTCHTPVARDMGLGFSAIQLNHDLSGLSLAMLRADQRLTADISLDAARIPGDSVENEALGYLHANCGHCHGGPAAPGPGLRMRSLVGTSSVEESDAFTTAVGVPSNWFDVGITARIVAGDPGASAIFARLSRRGGGQMPPLGTEAVDDVGAGRVSAWIDALGDD